MVTPGSYEQRSCLNPRSVPHPNRGAEKLYYLSHYLWIHNHFSAAKLVKFVNTFLFRNHIDPRAKIGSRLELAHGGDGVVINGDTVIGDDAIIFHNTTIGNGGTRIGDRVYIGAGATILGKVEIGDDVAIGANSVVVFDVPSGTTVVGEQARIIPKQS